MLENNNIQENNLGENPPEKDKNHLFAKGVLVGVLVAVFIGAVICLATGTLLVYGIKQFSKESGASEDVISESAKMKMNLIENFISQKGYYDMDEIDFETGIYRGLVEALNDPYAEYYTKEEAEVEKGSEAGTFSGIGATLQKNVKTGECVIVNIIDDSPSEKAGLRVDDRLVKVNGENCTNLSLDEIVSRVRGEKGTAVTLTIYREGEELFDVDVIRDDIVIESISSRMLDDEIGYIRIDEFNSNTDKQFTAAIDDLKKQGMKKIIFDVRYNGGGDFDTVVKMLDEILPEGLLVYTENKKGDRIEKRSDANCLDCPMIVLVNEYTASASEIFTAAIQDFGAGKVIGTKTYGKGIVQGVYRLYDGSCLKFTIEKYFTPSGKCIHGEGITPDIEAEPRWVGDEDAEEYDELYDAQVLLGMKELGADVEIPEEPEE